MLRPRNTFNPFRTFEAARSKFFAVVRVGAYATVFSLVVGAVLTRKAMAEAKETSLVAGRQLEKLGEVLGETKTVRLNGQRFHVSTGYVDLDVEETLDRFQEECMEHESAFTRMFSEEGFKKLLDTPPPALGPLTHEAIVARKPFGVGRHSDENEGMIACFADRKNKHLSSLEVLKRVADTGDLGELGDARYAYVKRVRGKHKSHVVSVWTDGSFNIDAMLPSSDDVPGEESSLVPRPTRSRRAFVATSENAPYGVRIYESTASPDAIYEKFDKEMEQLGWERAKNGDIAPDHRLFVHTSGVFCETFARKKGRFTEFSTVELGHSDRPLSSTFDP